MEKLANNKERNYDKVLEVPLAFLNGVNKMQEQRQGIGPCYEWLAYQFIKTEKLLKSIQANLLKQRIRWEAIEYISAMDSIQVFPVVLCYSMLVHICIDLIFFLEKPWMLENKKSLRLVGVAIKAHDMLQQRV